MEGAVERMRVVIELLRLKSGQRVLDVGCGSGADAVALAGAGLAVTGVDSSSAALGRAASSARAAHVAAAFFDVDAREMPFDDEFHSVVSLHPGAFGAMGDDDALVLRRMAEAVRPGGRVLVTARNAYNAAATLPEGSRLDVGAGVVVQAGGSSTALYTPRELKLLAIGVGLIPMGVWSVDARSLARHTPNAHHSELMLMGQRPPG